MEERLLRIEEVAEMLSTSKNRARAILAERKIHPVDLGAGRSGGLRWLRSLVVSALQAMSQEAQEKSNKRRQGRNNKKVQAETQVSLLNMSIDDIFKLTHNQNVQ